LVPATLCYAVVLLLFLPVISVFKDFFPNYSAALKSWWAAGWPALLAVCIVSVVLAFVCYRRTKRISEYGLLAWALFVFLLGAPGLVGYLLHRRWPVTEKCQHCGEITPRDRDACLDCGTEFPLPPLKGIEIFA
jgi:hypothetical protein